MATELFQWRRGAGASGEKEQEGAACDRASLGSSLRSRVRHPSGVRGCEPRACVWPSKREAAGRGEGNRARPRLEGTTALQKAADSRSCCAPDPAEERSSPSSPRELREDSVRSVRRASLAPFGLHCSCGR